MRESGKLPGQSRIYTAGEKEFDNEPEILNQGVPLNDALMNTMKTLVEEFDLDFELPF